MRRARNMAAGFAGTPGPTPCLSLPECQAMREAYVQGWRIIDLEKRWRVSRGTASSVIRGIYPVLRGQGYRNISRGRGMPRGARRST